MIPRRSGTSSVGTCHSGCEGVAPEDAGSRFKKRQNLTINPLVDFLLTSAEKMTERQGVFMLVIFFDIGVKIEH